MNRYRKRFLNGAKRKRNPWWCRVDIKSGTFSLHFSAQPPLSQNSNLYNRFLCYFLCSIWKVWGLSELLLTCQHILTASCEYTRTLPVCRYFLGPASCERSLIELIYHHDVMQSMNSRDFCRNSRALSARLLTRLPSARQPIRSGVILNLCYYVCYENLSRTQYTLQHVLDYTESHTSGL